MQITMISSDPANRFKVKRQNLGKIPTITAYAGTNRYAFNRKAVKFTSLERGDKVSICQDEHKNYYLFLEAKGNELKFWKKANAKSSYNELAFSDIHIRKNMNIPKEKIRFRLGEKITIEAVDYYPLTLIA